MGRRRRFHIRNLSLRNMRGATTLEQALVLPLWLGVFIILRDVYVVGSTWISLQHAANEGIRTAILGSDLADSDTQTNKVNDIIDDTLGRILELQIRSGIVKRPAGVDEAQLSNHSYLDGVVSGMAVSDPTAHSDITFTKSQISVTDEGEPLRWWVSVESRRTLKASEGALSPLANAALFLSLGTEELVLTARAEGKIEKPLN